MKIQLQSDNNPLTTDDENNKNIILDVDSRSRLYLQLDPNSKNMPRRHPGELVMRNGWVCLDYDNEGFLIGLEFVQGDPMTGVSECIQYLQPINPLLQ
jgi:hypothetical protein